VIAGSAKLRRIELKCPAGGEKVRGRTFLAFSFPAGSHNRFASAIQLLTRQRHLLGIQMDRGR